MNVRVSEVSGSQPPIVSFESNLGSGRGKWMVGSPLIGANYDVEFTMPVLRWGEQISPSDRREPRIAVANDQVLITLLIESVDFDGVLKLRLGESAVLAETTGVGAAEPGGWIDLRLPTLELYDTNS